MANYPPPPPYGPPFDTNSHIAQPIAPYNPGMPQHPYHHHGQAPYYYGQNQPNGQPPNPHMNSYSYHVNGQGTPPVPGHPVNPTTYVGYGSQVYHGAIPPPPYPPAQIQSGVPPYVPQPAAHFPSSSNSASHPTPITPATTDVQEVVKTQVTTVESPNHSIPHASELEDGEVNDGESDTLEHFPDADKMGSSFSRNPQGLRDDKVELSTAAPGSSNLSSTQQDDPPIKHVSRVVAAEQGYSSSLYPYQASNQNNTGDTSRVVTLDQPSGEDLRMDTPEDATTKVTEDMDVLKTKWEEAKQALLDLRSQGIGFTQIVERGVSPVMLRKLHADVGIPISRDMPKPTPPLAESRIVSGRTPDLSPPDKVPTNNVDQQPVPVLQDKGKASSTTKTPITMTKVENVPLTGSTSTSKPAKPSVINLSGKATNIKAGDSKGVDRKEYIARLAAAKASVSSKAASTPTVESPIQATISRTPPTATTKHSPKEPVVDRAQDPEVEAKRKAQTDLARQKMEALKRRETVQQQSQTPKSHEGDHQEQRSLAGPQQASSFTAPATISQSLVPSRQGSYFSPVTQKPPFSIPGLFMTSDTFQNIPQPVPAQAVAPIQQRDIIIALGPEPRHSISHDSGEQSKSPLAPQEPSTPSVLAITHPSAVPAINPTPAATSRKRQKAADFIDSPSTRIKRPLGQQEDSSLIIDISEDDSSNVSDDDDLSIGRPEHAIALTKKSNIGQTGSGKQRSIGDLPPLSELPTRKKSTVMTPPAAQTPGQTKDPKQLKSKEMEIELMRRKIAELEQRNHAKRNTSRAQSPGTSMQVPVSSPLREPLQSANDPTKPLVGAVNVKADTKGLDSTRQSSSTSTETRESVTEDRLTVEQRLREVDLAIGEAEHSVAVDNVASEQDRQLQEEALQASRQEEGLSQAQKPTRDQDRNGYDVEHVRLNSIEQQGSPRSMQVAHEVETPEVGAEVEEVLRQQEERLQQQEADQRRQQAEQQKLLDEQQRIRKAEIEAGLPVLDATVARTKQRIESLKKEMMELEEEIQKGVEGRKSLMEELSNLSQAVGTPESVVDDIGKSASRLNIETQRPSEKEEEKVLSKSAPYTGTSHEPSLRPDAEISFTSHDDSTASARVAAEELSEGELEEDVMDISRSDADEGEISDHSPEQMAVDQDKQSLVDDEESYEPSSDIITARQPEPPIDTAHPGFNDDRRANEYGLDVVTDVPTDDAIFKTTTEEPNSSEDFASSGNTQDEIGLQYQKFSVANDSDLDDYEPPEPASVEEDSALQPMSVNNSSHASVSASGLDQDNTELNHYSEPLPGLRDHLTPSNTAAKTDSQERTTQQTNYPVGHFIPYESPLKQFKSYRYHPEYLKEASQGFRSLTYSHAINSEIPICRYEIGGVCNDDSCQSQHFRSLALNDDKILLELGARPEGLSPQEQEDYTTGLRNIIQDIRNRRIKDVNTVASEITAYRTRFIGDNTKILPL